MTKKYKYKYDYSVIVDEISRIFGSQANLASKLKITRQSVYQWRRIPIPLFYVRKICKMTNYQILPSFLRPDIAEFWK